MEVIILPSIEECANLGACMVSELVTSKPNTVLGLATGSTPIPVYTELVRLHNESGLSFSKIKSFNLDERWMIGQMKLLLLNGFQMNL